MTMTRGGARSQRSTAAAVEDEGRVPKATRSSLRRSSEMSSDQRAVGSFAGVSSDEPEQHHRSKRVKTERPDGHEESSTIISTEAAAFASAIEDDGAVESTSDARAQDIADLAARAAQAAMESMDDFATATATEGEAPAHDRRRTSITERQPSLPSSNLAGDGAAPDVDFSSAPSDPTELALWVAKQISNFGDGARDSADSEGSNAARARLHGHPPAIYNRRFDEDDDPTKVAERERVREENRERKKRWRESNAERNKDNDLRCRITKRAKTLWGSTRSAERSAWMEAEFNKRRAKRESKERVRSFDDDFSGFAFAPGFGSTLFPAPGVGPQGETNAAGLLLANALLGVGSNGTGPNAEAANALKAALEGGAVDPKPFTEALRAMAANPEIMNGINVILGGYSGYEDGSGDEEMSGIMQTTEAQHGGRRRESDFGRQQSEVDDEQSEIVKKLNQATAMLNELNETNEASQGTNGFTPINGDSGEVSKSRAERAASNEESDEHGLDQDQIDALLTLANGGTLPSHPGQAESSDDLGGLADALNNPPDNHANGPQPDNDMSAILQRIIEQVMVQREERDADDATSPMDQTTHDVSAAPAAPQHYNIATSDPFGVAKNPAMALSSLLHCAGMSINTVIPAAQSHATSQLYARLSNHSRCSTPSGGGINPAHASAFGSTASMNKKLLARPNAYSRPLHTPNTVPRAGPIGPPPRPRNPEVERKARSFGFPPMPGTKMAFGSKGKQRG